jgi:hypothetical protein
MLGVAALLGQPPKIEHRVSKFLLRRSSIPLLSARAIFGDNSAVVVIATEIVLSVNLALPSRPEEEGEGLGVVHRNTETVMVGVTKLLLGFCIALRGSGREPAQRFRVVDRKLIGIAVPKGQVDLSADQAPLRSRAHEGLATSGVDRPAITVEVELS